MFHEHRPDKQLSSTRFNKHDDDANDNPTVNYFNFYKVVYTASHRFFPPVHLLLSF